MVSDQWSGDEGENVVTAVVLAGGKSRRMERDKLELLHDGATLLESVVARFKHEFSVVLSVADAAKYPHIKTQRIVDILPGAGPLSGLHAALKTLPDEGVFLVAADLPFACPAAAERITRLCGEKEACVIKLPDGRLEPLFGYYKKSLLARSEEAISSGNYRMSDFIALADTRFIDPVKELGDSWDERIVLNINYPEDYEKIVNIY